MKVLLPMVRHTGFVFAAAIAMTSCSGESPLGSAEEGGFIRVSAELDAKVDDLSRANSQNEITVGDLSFELISADGKVDRKFSSLEELRIDERFAPGEYTFSAYYGSEDSEGFDSPFYYGDDTFTVTNGRVSEVNVVASLANTMLSIMPTESFSRYFDGKFSVTAHSEGGAYIEFGPEESRAAYLRAGSVSLTASVTLPSGIQASMAVGSFKADPRTHYTVTLDLADNFGDAEIVVTFDDRLDQEPVSILLSDDLVKAPAPTITPQGADATSNVTVVEGCIPDNDLRFDIVAPAHLRSLVMTTTGNQALLAAGWPAEVDLMNVSDEVSAILNSFGLRVVGTSNSPATFASVVLTDVISVLRGSGATFVVSATDRFGKVSDPQSIVVGLEPQVISIKSAEPLSYMASEAVLTVDFNGNMTDDVLTWYVAAENSDQWTKTNVVSIKEGSSSGSYKVTVAVPLSLQRLQVKAESEVAQSAAFKLEREPFNLNVSARPGAVWASRAYLNLSSSTFSDDDLNAAQFMVSVDSGDASRISAQRQSDGSFLLAGLTPATTYNVSAIVGEAVSEPITFTTEKAALVPNGDFEDLRSTISANLQQGGQWTITTIGSTAYTTKVDINVSEPTGWASTNGKTFYGNASNPNTWYMVPSVYNTGLSWVTHQPTAKIMNIGQTAYNETPGVYKELAAASGANAMVVRNVAWDANGAKIPTLKQTGNTSYSNYYCSTVPSIANRSIGRMFLGEYSFDGSSESIAEGVDFASRPMALTGVYKYENTKSDPDEKGFISVEILSGNEIIGSGSVELAAVADYTEFTIPVVYSITNLSATSLRIMIASSNHEDDASVATDNQCNKLECCSRGAALTVDNLKFNY